MPLQPSDRLTFDIETSGIDPESSSVLSISYKRPGDEKVSSLYARPSPGTKMSRWSSSKVWEPIKDKAKATEEEILTNFLGVVQSHKGKTVAGWNIGAVPPTHGPAIKGFDIPMLIKRAEKYGLHEKYKEAFSQVKIRDIGREFALSTAQEVKKYPGLVEPKLEQQAIGYAKLGERYVSTPFQKRATLLGFSNYQMSGWKQEIAYKLGFGGKYSAHQSESDVQAIEDILSLPKETFQGPEFVQKGGKEALHNKLINKAFTGATRGEEPSSVFSNILSRAKEFGIEGIEADIRSQAADKGAIFSHLTQGLGFREAETSGQGLLHSLISQGRKNPVSWGLAAVAGTIAVARPWNWFSGKDDNYNTIEGLSHKGITQETRHKITDFGSGYIGLLPTPIQRLFSLGIYSKTSLVEKLPSFISSKDDDYNSIEGLSHKGVGQQKRHELTDFGSGWVGIPGPVAAELVEQTIRFGARFSGTRTDAFDYLPSISSDDNDYNTIEGMSHRGIAKYHRWRFTDFGSGWDALRGLLRASETFEGMAASREFQSVLKSATFQKKLGQGAFSEAHLMKSSFRGKEFEFVRKFTKAGQLDVDAIKEGRILQDLEKGGYKNAPSFYGSRTTRAGTELDQEYFRGESLSSSAGQYQTKATAAVQGLHQQGILHRDLHSQNVMVVNTPGGGKEVGIIDYGKSQYLKDIEPELRDIKKESDTYVFNKMFANKAPNRFSARDDRSNTIEGLGHGGFAANIRHILSDFGSGLISSLFEGASGLLAKKVTASGMKQGIKSFLEEEGVQVVKNQPLIGFFKHPITGSQISLNPSYLKANVEGVLGRKISGKELDIYSNLTLAHEASEFYHYKRFAEKGLLKQRKVFGSHYSPAIIADEMLMAAKSGHFQEMKNFRLGELSLIEKDSSLSKQYSDYIRRTRKMYSSFETKWLPKFNVEAEPQAESIFSRFKNLMSSPKTENITQVAEMRAVKKVKSSILQTEASRAMTINARAGHAHESGIQGKSFFNEVVKSSKLVR
jgi:serine/threonine protein kinase